MIGVCGEARGACAEEREEEVGARDVEVAEVGAVGFVEDVVELEDAAVGGGGEGAEDEWCGGGRDGGGGEVGGGVFVLEEGGEDADVPGEKDGFEVEETEYSKRPSDNARGRQEEVHRGKRARDGHYRNAKAESNEERMLSQYHDIKEWNQDTWT